MKVPTIEQLKAAEKEMNEKSRAIIAAGGLDAVPDEIVQLDKLMRGTSLFNNAVAILDLRFSHTSVLSAALTAAFELGASCAELGTPASSEVQ